MLVAIYSLWDHYAANFAASSNFSRSIYRLTFSSPFVRRLTFCPFWCPLPPTIFSRFSIFSSFWFPFFHDQICSNAAFYFAKYPHWTRTFQEYSPPTFIPLHRCSQSISNYSHLMYQESSTKFPRKFSIAIYSAAYFVTNPSAFIPIYLRRLILR